MADLFPNWTWQSKLPPPFDDPAIHTRSTSSYSKYCEQSNQRATLHGPTLQAILSYMDMDTSLNAAASGQCAIGLQSPNWTIAEYMSRSGKIHAVAFNRTDGKYHAGVFTDPQTDCTLYKLSEQDGQTGTALLFALMPILLEDDEFGEHYSLLGSELQKSAPDMNVMLESVFVLCDNAYRRIKRSDLGDSSIGVVIPGSKKISRMTAQRINDGLFSPTSVLYGDFQILLPNMAPAQARATSLLKDWVGRYADLSRALTPEEESLIPQIPLDYVVPEEVEDCVTLIAKTRDMPTPLINAMFRGPAGPARQSAGLPCTRSMVM